MMGMTKMYCCDSGYRGRWGGGEGGHIRVKAKRRPHLMFVAEKKSAMRKHFRLNTKIIEKLYEHLWRNLWTNKNDK